MKSGGPASPALGEEAAEAIAPDEGGSAAAAEPAQQAASAGGRPEKVRGGAAVQARRDKLVLDFFAQPVRDQAARSAGRPVSVLRAGCQTPLTELGLHRLQEGGHEISVLTVDADDQRLRALTEAENSPFGREAVFGDLRTIPLPPRSFDVVHCSLLLDRVGQVPLVLDRLSAALRPGGLLLLRIRDRDCAAGWLDRRLPMPVRRALWRQLYPGEPGPFRAVYEPTASAKGIAAYLLMRGMVISQRRTTRTLPHQPERLCRVLSVLRRMITVGSRGRLTDAHDEVLFVIRKPEDRFARVVLTRPLAAGRHART